MKKSFNLPGYPKNTYILKVISYHFSNISNCYFFQFGIWDKPRFNELVFVFNAAIVMDSVNVFEVTMGDEEFFNQFLLADVLNIMKEKIIPELSNDSYK